ncbi:MAG: class I SAM-dependent methyltransferase [Bacteroidota bacterium]|jgi:SAM-dependent methyltransferase
MDFSLIYRSKIVIKAFNGWIHKTDKVLDIGCGNAVVAEELRNYFGCPIVGTDIIDYRERNIDFKMMNYENKLPFGNNEFDISLFVDSLHHCNYQSELLQEASRVSKKILIFEAKPTLLAKILDWGLNQIHNKDMNIPFSMKTLDKWCDYFKELDFDFEYREIKKPSFWYPFINFAFMLKQKNGKQKGTK